MNELVALLNGKEVGIVRHERGRLAFTYADAWRSAPGAYPLSTPENYFLTYCLYNQNFECGAYSDESKSYSGSNSTRSKTQEKDIIDRISQKQLEPCTSKGIYFVPPQTSINFIDQQLKLYQKNEHPVFADGD